MHIEAPALNPAPTAPPRAAPSEAPLPAPEWDWRGTPARRERARIVGGQLVLSLAPQQRRRVSQRLKARWLDRALRRLR